MIDFPTILILSKQVESRYLWGVSPTKHPLSARNGTFLCFPFTYNKDRQGMVKKHH